MTSTHVMLCHFAYRKFLITQFFYRRPKLTSRSVLLFLFSIPFILGCECGGATLTASDGNSQSSVQQSSSSGQYGVKEAIDAAVMSVVQDGDDVEDLKKCMYAIAKVESEFNPRAHNRNANEDSYGLYQLNVLGGRGAAYANNPEALYDPYTNAGVAIGYLYYWYKEAVKNHLHGADAARYMSKNGQLPAGDNWKKPGDVYGVTP